jgi:hypothetical protein
VGGRAVPLSSARTLGGRPAAAATMWSLEVPRLRLVIFGLVLGVSSSTLERGGALAADAAQLPLPDDPVTGGGVL